ncbi:MAG: Hsp70 family protein [Planctomycetota bacterium]|nr:Hsp70 family protein [Planctomycetota bacterium]
MPYTVGIDLGTTNSPCAVFRDDRPEPIPNSHGSFLTSSVVGVIRSGEIVVGATAKKRRFTQPGATARCFKQFMGSDKQLRVEQVPETAGPPLAHK